jgi:FkbM family methyltransferase
MIVPDFVGPFLSRHPSLMKVVMKTYGKLHGCRITWTNSKLRVTKGSRQIEIAPDLSPYLRDLVDHFEMYFYATEPRLNSDEVDVRDYSVTKVHKLRGWSQFDVLMPGLPEPMDTVEQYLELLQLKPGESVLDLGGYAGLTALRFQEAVGATGRVVSVEADPTSYKCVEENFRKFGALHGFQPTSVNAAIWDVNGLLAFISEASLGSAIAAVLPRAQAKSVQVQAITLSELVKMSSIQRVDAIKADIEGAEFQAFSDSHFFEKFHPRIVFEPADTGLKSTKADAIIQLLRTYGYEISWHPQVSSRLPLILCV